MKQNWDKIGCSIQAVLKVVSMSVRFFYRGARCFMGRFTIGLVTICSVFWRIDDSGFKNLEELYRRLFYAVRVAVNCFFLRSDWFDVPCQAM